MNSRRLLRLIALAGVLAFGAIETIPPLLAQSSPNLAFTLLSSALRTATPINSTDQTNISWESAHFIFNVSAYTTGSYTPHIQGKDPASGTYYDILVGPALNATATTVLKVGPGFTATANASAADMLPRTWRVNMVGSATPSMTFSVGVFLSQ